MKYEKAKEIICDAIFNGEYRATEEQEEAFDTIFHEERKEPINEDELAKLSVEAYREISWRSHMCKEAFFDAGFRAGYRKAKEE